MSGMHKAIIRLIIFHNLIFQLGSASEIVPFLRKKNSREQTVSFRKKLSEKKYLIDHSNVIGHTIEACGQAKDKNEFHLL